MPILNAQRDFRSGELDIDAKRHDDQTVMRAGARQMRNWRILASGAITQRSGRRALFKETGRVEEIQLGTSTFFIAFGAGTLRIYNSTGATQLFTESGRPWSNATAKKVVYAIFGKSIYICFTSGIPRVLTWDGATAFTAADYAEDVTLGGQKRTFFYRISPQNITMLPAARSGAGVALVFSAGMNLIAGHVGTRMRFCSRQILITAVADATHATGTIEEPLPGSQVLTFAADPTPNYNIADEVIGSVSNSKGIVTAINAGAKTITVQILTTESSVVSTVGAGTINVAFTTADVVVGISGSATPSSVAAIGNPAAVSIWDDEVMNTLRGWPQSVSVDQGRLIFTNFAVLPRGIGWSWFGLPTDLYVEASSTAAMFELAPGNSQVYFVSPGPDGSEFVFCDNGLWYIPITVNNPLKPGSVVFLPVSRDGCANVQPRLAMESLFFINSGLTAIMAVVATGGATHPYSTNEMSELRSHLFTSPIAIAIPTTAGSFPERYIYVLNSDGTLAVGKIITAGGTTPTGGQVNTIAYIGWVPWSGVGTVAWIAALNADLIFTTNYAPNAITPVSVIEILDGTKYLDGSILYNAVPAGLPVPGGSGPLWWLASGSVDLMDGALPLGTYLIDASGFLIPNMPGEDLSSATLSAGQPWTSTLEPFVPNAEPGQDQKQRTRRRRIPRVAVTVERSTGFKISKLYSGPLGSLLPAAGTEMGSHRIAAWSMDDNQAVAPPLRDQTYTWRPTGRSFDPRIAIVKDVPGPITVVEVAMEATT